MVKFGYVVIEIFERTHTDAQIAMIRTPLGGG